MVFIIAVKDLCVKTKLFLIYFSLVVSAFLIFKIMFQVLNAIMDNSTLPYGISITWYFVYLLSFLLLSSTLYSLDKLCVVFCAEKQPARGCFYSSSERQGCSLSSLKEQIANVSAVDHIQKYGPCIWRAVPQKVYGILLLIMFFTINLILLPNTLCRGYCVCVCVHAFLKPCAVTL